MFFVNFMRDYPKKCVNVYNLYSHLPIIIKLTWNTLTDIFVQKLLLLLYIFII